MWANQYFVGEAYARHFLDLTNRGGLTYQSNLLFIVSQYAYWMFNVYISSVECTYLEVAHQKQTFFGFIEPFITNNEECKEILVMYEECKIKFILCIMKAMSNNYSRDNSDYITTVAQNDIAYTLCSCHSGLVNRCANCVDTSQHQQWGPMYRFWGQPGMRTRLMAGTAPHKSGRCRD